MSSIIESNNILEIYKYCKNLIDGNNNVVLFLDIDDTILSSQIDIKLIDPNSKHLIELIYRTMPNNLFFLTARDSECKDSTIKELNYVRLLNSEMFICYNVIHSPYKFENGNFIPTKGETLLNFLNKTTSLSNENPNWIIFVDDDIEQINNVSKHLTLTSFSHVLFHYQHRNAATLN